MPTLTTFFGLVASHLPIESAYLQDVLTKLANDWPYARLDELLPAEWKRRQAAAASSNDPPQASTISD